MADNDKKVENAEEVVPAPTLAEKAERAKLLFKKSDDKVASMEEEAELDVFMADPEVRAKMVEEPEDPKPAEVSDPEPKAEEPKPEPSDTKKVEGEGEENESREALLEALKKERAEKAEAKELLAKRQATIDSYNAKSGEIGNKYKSALKQLEEANVKQREYEAKLEELTSKEDDVPELKPPDLPADETELMDLNSQYNREMRKYHENLAKAANLSAKRTKQLIEEGRKKNAELVKLQSVVNEYEEKVKIDKVKETVSLKDKRLNELFTEIDGLQTKYPELKTSRSFKEVNQDVLDHGLDYLKNISEDDYAKFLKVRGLAVGDDNASGYGTFDENVVFHKNGTFKTLEEVYFLNLNRSGEYEKRLAEGKISASKEAAKQLADVQTKNKNSAVIIPSDISGGENPFDKMSKADIDANINKLLDKSEAGTSSREDEMLLDKLEKLKYHTA